MSKLTAWLIRHGESMANVGRCAHKPAEIPLTEKGHQQALQLADVVLTRPDLIIISPFQRTYHSAAHIINRWQDVPVEIWPIQELTYLAHDKYQAATDDEQQQMVDSYWQRADPLYSDGEGAESFAAFMDRLQDFHQQLSTCNGFVIVLGHGHFIKAYQLGLHRGFQASSDWMKQFRTREIAQPIANAEIIKLSRGDNLSAFSISG